MFKSRIVEEKVKIKTLFERFNIPNTELAAKELLYKINIKTPHGWNRIKSIFRTDRQVPVRIYFGNNKTLKCSLDHKLMTNTGWKLVKDLDINSDVIHTKRKTTTIKKISVLKTPEILYDMSVSDVHCYYSNGVVSHNSWLLTCIGAAAIKSAKTVFHYTLELNQSYSGLRYDAVLSGITLEKLPMYKERLPAILKEIPGKLYIKWYPMRSVSLMGIRSHIDKAKTLGTSPDLIILDYADLLKYTGTADKEDIVLKSLYEDLKGFAGELNIPVWTVSQANREGLDQEILEANKISAAYSKIFPADFVASLSRKRQDKVSNTARMHIIKNRYGPDGMTFPMLMDTHRGVIDIYNELSTEGKGALAKMETDSKISKDNARKRYAEMFKKDDKKIDW